MATRNMLLNNTTMGLGGLLFAALLGGCAASTSSGAPRATSVAAAPATPAQGGSSGTSTSTTRVIIVGTTDITPGRSRFDDAEIGAILEETSVGEIEQAQVALKHAQRGGAKSFAAMMVSHQNEVRDKQAKLFNKLTLTPSESTKSRELKADVKKNLDALSSLKGSEFDRAYMDVEIKEHEEILSMLDSLILPNVQNDEYKALLQDVRGRVEDHLKVAQDLRSQLATGG